MAQGATSHRHVTTTAALNDLSDVNTSGVIDDDVLTYDSASGVWGPAAGGGGAAVDLPQWMEYLNARQTGESSNTNDDFFDNASVDSWADSSITGTCTATEKYDKLSLYSSGGGASDFQGVLKAISGTPSAPTTIETAVSMLAGTATGTGMSGICFTDGTAASSNLVAIRFWANQQVSVQYGTLTAVDSSASTILNRTNYAILGRLYMRLAWTAANTFEPALSIDGVSWSDFGLASISKTMTPTHVGLYCLDWSGSEALASFDYFRYDESDLSA